MPTNSAAPSSALSQNLERAERALARFRSSTLAHLISGRPHDGSGDTFDNLNPVDNTVLCRVASGDAEDVDRPRERPPRRFPLGATCRAGRRTILHAIADRIDARAEEIALVESMDTGQPIRFVQGGAPRSRELPILRGQCARRARWPLAPHHEHLNYTMRMPIGPVGVITPWNTPFMLSTWKIAPALAAGCTVVHKPAECTPLTADAPRGDHAEAITAAGLPAGVGNMVHGLGEAAGKAVTEHPAIQAIAFVGESVTGQPHHGARRRDA